MIDAAQGLLDQHNQEQIRQALVAAYVTRRSVPSQRLDGTVTARLCEMADSDLMYRVIRTFGERQALSLKDLEHGLEILLHPEKRRKKGIVYTPTWIIDYLLRTGLELVESGNGRPVIADPACGVGGFLIHAAEVLQDHGVPIHEAFEHYLIGLDTDPVALRYARALIEILLAERGVKAADVPLRLIQKDTVTTPAPEVLDETQSPDGFDLITTNPPYVKLQNLDNTYRDTLMKKYPAHAKGSFGLSLLFLVAAQKLIKSSGAVAFVTQNNLFTSLAARSIRKDLQENRAVKRIVDFGDRQVFDGVSTYTCLLFLTHRRNKVIEYDRLSESDTIPPCLDPTRLSHVEYEKLDPKKWRLAPQPHLDNILRIEDTGTPLGQLCPIRVGFATLKDSVFLARIEDSKCIAGQGKHVNPAEIEIEITRPAIKIADVENETELRDNSTRVLFPYYHNGATYQPLGEDEIRATYPRAWSYLCEHRGMLDARDKGKGDYPWYTWGRRQGMEAPGPKLLTKTFNNRPNFLFDESDQLFCNGYAVMQPQASLWLSISLPLLKRILNSQLMAYYAKLTSFQISGGYQCYQKNFIERFGIPHFSDDQLRALDCAGEREFQEMLCDAYGIDESDLKSVVND